MSAVDTIVAPATPAGVGERAVVRLSGPRAWHVLRDALSDVPRLEPRRLLAARLPLGDDACVGVELMLWRAPRSATGEDLAEVHLPGWPAAVAELLRRLVAAGCRPAQPGEFTRRALLLGKLELAQAAALGALGRASDAPALAAALEQLVDGGDRALDALRGELLDTLALLEAHVDHEDDDTEALAEGRLPAALTALAERARAAERDGAARAAVDGELTVLLLGPPNAGKSSLLLALCPDARTTPSPIPGTTRDALVARRRVGARTLRLVDGPGVSWERVWDDPLDEQAMRLWLEQLPRDAVVLDLDDASAPSSAAERARRRAAAADRPRVAAWNKCDLVDAPPAPLAGAATPDAAPSRAADTLADDPPSAASTPAATPPADAADGADATDDAARLRISARTGAGLDALLHALLAAAPELAPLAARHALERELFAELRALLEPLRDDAPRAAAEGALPLVALALREALQRLDDHAQRADDLDEALLDRVFAGFCLGK